MCILARLIELAPSSQRKKFLVAGIVENHDSFLEKCHEIPSYGLKDIIMRGADKEHLFLEMFPCSAVSVRPVNNVMYPRLSCKSLRYRWDWVVVLVRGCKLLGGADLQA